MKDGFDEGVMYALEYLAEIYDGINQTDLWREYMGEDDEDDN